MTPNELMNKYILARIIGWRHELEALDAEAVAELVKVLKSANATLLARIEAELPQVWDNYTSDKGGAAIRLWLGELLEKPAQEINTTITEAWSISAQQSLTVYNDILTFGGAAASVEVLPVTLETVKRLASRKLFAGYSLSELVGKAFSEGQIQSIVQSLDKSRASGLSYPKAIKELKAAAFDEGAIVTQRQAITLARSYIQQASVNAQLAVYEHNRNVVKGVKWCSILDNKVCPLCAATDGISYMFDEERPPMPRHPRCLLPESLVTAPDAIAKFVSKYEGPVYDIWLENGTKLSVTPNHPIMTKNGFIAACLLNEQSEVICNDLHTGIGKFAGERKEIVDILAYGKEVTGALPRKIKFDENGFHGDAKYFNKKESIVFIRKYPEKIDLDERYVLRNLLDNKEFNISIEEIFLKKDRDDKQVVKKWLYQFRDRISLYKVVCIKQRKYKGYVYDLQTISSLFYADGAIVSNCRCLWLPWVKSWRDLGIDADDLEKAARPWLIREPGNIDEGGNRKVLNFGTSKESYGGWWSTLPFEQQAQVIGPVRTRLIRNGELRWEDLVNKNSGKYFTLAELGFSESGEKL